VKLFQDINQPLKRYLTLFYGITLGLALVLSIWAIGLGSGKTDDISASSSVVLATEVVTTPISTEVHQLGKPTEIPAIPPTPNEVTPSPLGVTSSELQGIQLTLWHPWTGANATALKTILDEYSRTNQWGITVNVTEYEGFGPLDEAVDSAVISGTLPDVLIDYGYQAQHLDDSRVLANLTRYVEDPVWGLTDAEQADFYSTFWAEDIQQGPGSSQARRLGIPFYRSAYVLFYNRSWAQELGFSTPPGTPEAFKKQACAATEAKATQGVKTTPGAGGWLITTQPGVAVGWIYAFGGGITNPDASGYLFNTPETSQAFGYVKDLVDSSCAWVDPAVDIQSEFASRGALFVVGSLFDIPAQQQAFTEAGSLDSWEVIPFPSSRQPVVDTYGPSLLISQTSPAKQLAAWLVVKWLVYPHNQIDWVKTIETYPTRQSSASYLMENKRASPQWNQALELLPDAKSEPSLASWSMMRWALSDALTQLVGPKFTADQIPALLEKLDSTASEIYNQVR
jgi:multiple sugar transport system substrate-binding protein